MSFFTRKTNRLVFNLVLFACLLQVSCSWSKKKVEDVEIPTEPAAETHTYLAFITNYDYPPPEKSERSQLYNIFSSEPPVSQIRVLNVSERSLTSVDFETEHQTISFGKLTPGQLSFYRLVNHLYRDIWTEARMDARPSMIIRNHTKGTLLEPGTYTYLIGSSAFGNTLSVTPINDRPTIDDALITSRWHWVLAKREGTSQQLQTTPSPLSKQLWPFIEFTSRKEPGKLGLLFNGQTGCNSMNGTYLTDEVGYAKRLIIPFITKTDRECRAAVGESAEIFTRGLYGVNRYRFTKDELFIYTDEEYVLTFAKEHPATRLRPLQMKDGEIFLNPNRCPNSQSLIVTPHNNEVVSGTINFFGTATIDSYQYHKIEYAPKANTAEGFIYIDGANHEVDGGLLGIADSTTLPDGPYTFRLSVVDQMGNSHASCSVTIIIVNQPGNNPLLRTAVRPQDIDSSRVISPPSGLIYRHDERYWRIDADGQAKQLTHDDVDLAFSPSGLKALGLYEVDPKYTLYDFSAAEPVTKRYTVSGYARVNYGRWLDEETGIVGVMFAGEKMEHEDQYWMPGFGHLSLLNVPQNQLQVLEPDTRFHRLPQILHNEKIVYRLGDQIVFRVQEQVDYLDIESLNLPGDLYDFAFSPDARQMVSLVVGKFGEDEWAYIVSAADGTGQKILQTFSPIPIDGILPLGATWSPDGSWLLLDPPEWPREEQQIQLVKSDGSNRRILTRNLLASLLWVDDQSALITVNIDEWIQTIQYELETGNQQLVNLPERAIPVHFSQEPKYTEYRN
ncbi:MAG: META domain-containing protein [Chloroflexota bacterium]